MEVKDIIKRIHPYTFCIICRGFNEYYIVGNDMIIYNYLNFEKEKYNKNVSKKKRMKKKYTKKKYMNSFINYTESSVRINEKIAHYLKKTLEERNIDYMCINSRLGYIVTEYRKYEDNNMYSDYLFKAKTFNKKYMNLRNLIVELEERNYSIQILEKIMGIVAKR